MFSPCRPHEKPSFLQPAFDPSPPQPSRLTEELEFSERPSTPMTQPSSRPASATGERSKALGQGYVKISEVESTKRLNDALDRDNAQLEEEIAKMLRMNLRLRDNIDHLEGVLGLDHCESDDACREDGETD
mmetsp:Transcript_59312/g.94156  ORF Transcript_59312/g.94156 Transcript_59312/m.94156 type:complete len:131 (-) Transcript_59312:98-490(-)